MTNREKYFLKRDEYDTMMTIAENIQGLGTFCPITALGGKRPPCKHITQPFLMMRDCETCAQRWLNQETDQPRPQWQDVMMKNFLRKE